MSRAQRHNLCWHYPPNWNEFRNVLYWLLAAHPSLELDAHYVIEGSYLRADLNPESGFFVLHEQKDGQSRFLHRDWLVDWGRVLKPLFPIRLQSEVIGGHRCAQLLAEEEYDHGIGCNRPPISQHERLEALLALREWGNGKVPDELLATLQ